MTQQYNQSEEMITIDDSGSEDDDTYVPDCCEEEDYNLAQAIQASLDATPGANPSSILSPKSRTANSVKQRNDPRQRRASSPIYEILHSYDSFLGEHIIPGDTVELQCEQDRQADAKYMPSGDFLRVHEIQRHWSDGGKIILNGVLFRRTKYMKSIFRRRLNEVCMVLIPGTIGTVGTDDILNHSMVSRPIEEVVKKRNLCLTNEEFPLHSFWTQAGPRGRNKHEIFYDHNLVCRWAYLGEDYVLGKPHWLSEMVFMRLTQELCRPIELSSDVFAPNRTLWKGDRRLEPLNQSQLEHHGVIEQFMDEMARVEHDSSPQAGCDQANAIDVDAELDTEALGLRANPPAQALIPAGGFHEGSTLTHVETNHQHQNSSQQGYTVCDIFSSGGGWSQSAKMAGLKVILAVDKDPYCTVIYEKNHPHVEFYADSIEHFLDKFSGRWPRIDILLISPTCKFFSPAKRGPSKDDEANLAVLFSVEQIVKEIQPRVVVLEQTFGLSTWQKHRVFYFALLGMFTANGYNVRSKNILLANYGCYQERKRLVCFATRAGETLPEFPTPTHDKYGTIGLQPWRTVREFLPAIANLSQGRLHQPSEMKLRHEDPLSLDAMLPTILTGNQCLHPSGTRMLTPSEASIAQGFPADYQWDDPQVPVSKARAMMGDAVPPNAFVHLLDHVRKHLQRVDSERAAGVTEG